MGKGSATPDCLYKRTLYPKSAMSTAPDSVSGGVDGPMSTQRGLQHALYMQKKLEGVYKKTSEFLAPGRERIAAAQNVLVWNRPMASAVLYLLVHFAFV